MTLFKRRRLQHQLRLFVASDLHGSTRCFKKLLRAPEFYEAKVIVLAGDLTGKMIVPIVKKDDAYVSQYQGIEQEIPVDELAQHEQRIESAGLYPYPTTREEVEELQQGRDRVDQIFERLMIERLESWLDLAEEKLAASNAELLVVPGNDDYEAIDAVLRKGERVKLIDGAAAAIDGHEVIGLGVSNPTPWNAPRDIPEDEIGKRLDALIADLEHPERAVFVIHVPPANSLLDLAPEIDENLRPTGAGTNFVHVGSIAVRQRIERSQPLLTLHGHIHESRGVDHIGRTICLNPGSEYGEGILRGAIVNLDTDRVAGHLFVSG